MLAWTYHGLGRDEKARTLLADALAGGARTAEVLFHAGMIEAVLGHRQRARQLLDQALATNPSFDPIGAREARDAWLALAPGAAAPPRRCAAASGAAPMP